MSVVRWVLRQSRCKSAALGLLLRRCCERRDGLPHHGVRTRILWEDVLHHFFRQGDRAAELFAGDRHECTHVVRGRPGSSCSRARRWRFGRIFHTSTRLRRSRSMLLVMYTCSCRVLVGWSVHPLGSFRYLGARLVVTSLAAGRRGSHGGQLPAAAV